MLSHAAYSGKPALGDVMLKGLIGIVLASLLNACAMTPASIVPRAGVDTITVDFGACYGPCPIFTLTIASDGEVRFMDRGQHRDEAVQRIVVEPSRYERVAAALAQYQPPHQLPACRTMVTDSQDFTVTWTNRSGATTTLHHYAGDTCEADEALTQVLLAIPDLVGVSDRVRPSRFGARRMR